MEYPWCNFSTMSQESSKLVRNFDIAFLITSSFGLMFNFLSMVVLLSSKLTSYSFLLIALSVADSIQLIYYLLCFGLPVFGNAICPLDLGQILPSFKWALGFVLDIAFTASVYIILLVSLDRYTTVSRSLRQDLRETPPWQTACQIFAVVILSGVYNSPKWFERKFCRVREIPGCWLPRDSFRLQFSGFYQDPVYQVFYVKGANIVVNWLVPLLILVYLNVYICRGLKELHLRKRRLVQRREEEREFSITIMIIFIVGFFCLCHMWYPVAQLGSGFGDALFWSKMYTYMYCLNSSVNFIIYCSMGKPFREEMKSVLSEFIELASLSPQHGRFMRFRFMLRWSTTVNLQAPEAGV